MNDQVNSRFPVRGPLMMGIVTLFVLVGGFGGWAALTNISGAVVSSGRVEVDQNRQVVQHPDGGVISEILVDEGDFVTPGQLLIRLDADELSSQLTIIEGQLFELMARRGRLQAERDGRDDIRYDPVLLEAAATNPSVAALVEGQTQLMQARANSIRQEVQQLEKRRGQIINQIEGLDAQRAALSTQLDLIKEELVSQRTLLSKGLAQAARVLSLQREEAKLAGQVGQLTAERAQAEGRITEIDLEILKKDTLRREEALTTLRDLEYRELEAAENRRAILQRLERLDIRAPVSGIVYGLQFFAPRSVIKPADPVLFLVPQDRPLVIAAQVPPIHIDEIFVGQDVTLRFSAFDQRQTPELFGTVVQISADAFTDQATQQTFYRIEVEPNKGELIRLPEGATLLPGMPVETFIRTQNRTPLAYLLKPLSDYFAKAFRE
ncbi:HlyD family type I secretion periplasmic adaptor subunit [Thalassovita sp.]|uniref:HlyD family type I secretion periplasmic adaptor subunit n=1 Tax=Thalassovita sp. TaxID=1979401 RepID=UPI0028810D84|nr:HlyD family type I secretion periplasmic adaptor subunit [Thalassovita sp.]MDF1802288.1 HlyD family type I secretion periplasmic adaptor subunit [Thalassovita sp.]